MRKGMVFTIEPIVCEGSPLHTIWPDGWTASTKDGGRCAQHEETIAIGDDGRAEILTDPADWE